MDVLFIVFSNSLLKKAVYIKVYTNCARSRCGSTKQH
jgi:hypothetical protein